MTQRISVIDNEWIKHKIIEQEREKRERQRRPQEQPQLPIPEPPRRPLPNPGQTDPDDGNRRGVVIIEPTKDDD